MRVEKISKDQWALLSKNSNAAVFGEQVNPSSERIDFAYILLMEESMKGFASCQERDADSVHIQYGGIALPFQHKKIASKTMHLLLHKLAEQYKRVTMLVENTNVPMLRLALSHGIYPIGIRTYKGSVLVEMGKEF